MKTHLSWFVLCLTRIVAADRRSKLSSEYMKDCKFAVESPAIKLPVVEQDPLKPETLEATPISGLYTFFRPIMVNKSRPNMILTKKIPVPGKKNYNYDNSEYEDPEVLIKYPNLQEHRRFRFIVNAVRTDVIVQAERHFCIRLDDAPKHWAIYNEATEQIIGWSMLVDDTTNVSCNPDVGLLRYIPLDELEVAYDAYELPTWKTFKTAYECVTNLKELERSAGIASKATAATLEIGNSQATCKYWHQSHDDLRYDADVPAEGICFLEEIEPFTDTLSFEARLIEAFSSCLMVFFGDETSAVNGPYLVDTSSFNPIVMKKQVIVDDLDYVTKLGGFDEPEATYYPDQGRIVFEDFDQFIEVHVFPCNPGNTGKGPFPVIYSDLTTTNRVVRFYTISGPEDIQCVQRGDTSNELECKSGVTYYCCFGGSEDRLQTCIETLENMPL